MTSARFSSPNQPKGERHHEEIQAEGPHGEDLSARFWGKVDRDGPVARDGLTKCWVWLGCGHTRGYGSFWLPGKIKALAHRFAWELHNGPVPLGLAVLHECDNRRCVRPDHLFLGTNADNSRDMCIKGRVGNCKLTVDGVVALRAARASGVYVAVTRLGRELGVGASVASAAARGLSWRHDRVQSPYHHEVAERGTDAARSEDVSP